MKIGVIGAGVVGGNVARWLGERGEDVLVYDLLPERASATLEEVVEECRVIFMCPFLPDNARWEGFATLALPITKMRDGVVVIVKSTVVPGTCDRLQEIFPLKEILFNPEFLTEANAEEDFRKPHVQVVGGGTVGSSMKVMEMLPAAPFSVFSTRRQAEWLKVATAGFLATKVSWFNQLYEAMGEEDFKHVRAMMLTDPRIGVTHCDVHQDGYRGWGGKCFTKDVPILAQVAPGMTLVKEAVRYNTVLRKETPTYALPL